MSIPVFPAKVTGKQIDGVIRFLSIIEGSNPDNFARLTESTNSTDGVLVLGRLEYHSAVHEFERACDDNGFVQSFEWGAWSDEAHLYMSNPSLVSSADLDTCIKLITTHLRAERFSEGHLEEVLRSGHITAILRRLRDLRRSDFPPM